MRKIIASSVFVMLFGLFSGPVLAGKVEVCEAIKHDPAYKGLYGLCNAYWNANERAQARILENFYKKAGPDGPGMPGLDEPEPAVCPCWAAGEIDLGIVPDPMGCQVAGTFALASYDFSTIQYVIGDQGPNSCGYMNFGGEMPVFTFFPDMNGENAPTDEEMEVCAEQLLERIAADFEDGCL